jgi:hypothetical protein
MSVKLAGYLARDCSLFCFHGTKMTPQQFDTVVPLLNYNNGGVSSRLFFFIVTLDYRASAHDNCYELCNGSATRVPAGGRDRAHALIQILDLKGKATATTVVPRFRKFLAHKKMQSYTTMFLNASNSTQLIPTKLDQIVVIMNTGPPQCQCCARMRGCRRVGFDFRLVGLDGVD